MEKKYPVIDSVEALEARLVEVRAAQRGLLHSHRNR